MPSMWCIFSVCSLNTALAVNVCIEKYPQLMQRTIALASTGTDTYGFCHLPFCSFEMAQISQQAKFPLYQPVQIGFQTPQNSTPNIFFDVAIQMLIVFPDNERTTQRDIIFCAKDGYNWVLQAYPLRPAYRFPSQRWSWYMSSIKECRWVHVNCSRSLAGHCWWLSSRSKTSDPVDQVGLSCNDKGWTWNKKDVSWG